MVKSENSYYSFYQYGSLQPSRDFNAGDCRFGFNGKENDNEVKGTGNSVDFGARIYNPRLGRWIATDPLQQKYPSYTPYSFVNNMPISAIDPDGKVIIFINGLWGWPNDVDGTAEYWGKDWVKRVQDQIGDHKDPLFFDGSLGGTNTMGGLLMSDRISFGKGAGYNNAKSIIENLDEGETIKIITNSMGAAYERGFSDGLYQYINERKNTLQRQIAEVLLERFTLSQGIKEERLYNLNLLANPTETEKKIIFLDSKLAELNKEIKKLENVKIEMVIDLSSHQCDYADKNAENNYYMVAGFENMNKAERIFVKEKIIIGAKFLGIMSMH